MSTIRWQPACCAWHGEYAEHAIKGGGVARLKRRQGDPQWHVMAFDGKGQPLQRDADGAPAYVEMPAAEAEALLA